LSQIVTSCARILKLLSDNFGKDVPDERVRACIELAGSVDAFEQILRLLENKKLIDVVSCRNARTGQNHNYPVLKQKAYRLIKVHGVEKLLHEEETIKW